jgi:putative ABC transport system permease protein
VQLPDTRYPTAAARAAFYERAENSVTVADGVTSGAIASHVPLGSGTSMRVVIDGGAEPSRDSALVTRVAVGDRYFDTLGLTLTRGRRFTAADAGADSVGIVNERFATLYFGGADPLGRRITLTPDSPGDAGPSITIVGVALTVRQRNIREPDADPVVYVPYRTAPAASAALIVRTTGDPAAAAITVRETVRAIDPDLPLFGISTMDEVLARTRWPYRVFGTMFTTFALIALALSAIGLYAITAYTVARRTHEIGLRIALGAEARQIWWMIVRTTFRPLAIGFALGLAGAIGAGRLLASLLAQTPATDPVTMVTIAAVFAIVAFAACLLPARRATAVDPMAALR